MNILVTGGAGFIGSHLCESLLAKGHGVVALDNLLLGRNENIAHLRQIKRFTFVKQDLCNSEAVDRIFFENEFDAVFHLAANSDIAKSISDPSVDLGNTFNSTFNVLSAMHRHGVKQIVFSSTSAVYGEVAVPIDEDYGPLLPVSHYGAAKLASEAFISSFSQCYGIQAWIARFPNVVGARSTHGVIFDFIGKLRRNPAILEVLGDGTQTKPYLHVSDLVSALCFIWEAAGDRLNIFNVGVDSASTVKMIAQEVVKVFGGTAEISYGLGDRGWVGDVPFFSYDLKKIFSLGWKPSYSSDDAVRLAIREILES